MSVLCRDMSVLCHDIKTLLQVTCHSLLLLKNVATNIFLPSALSLCHNILCYVVTFFLGFFSTFVGTIFSFIATKFLPVACCYSYDKPFLCRDIVLLSCTAETELCVVTNSDDVATYFLLSQQSFSQLHVNITTLWFKKNSIIVATEISIFSASLCRNIIFYVTTFFL